MFLKPRTYKGRAVGRKIGLVGLVVCAFILAVSAVWLVDVAVTDDDDEYHCMKWNSEEIKTCLKIKSYHPDHDADSTKIVSAIGCGFYNFDLFFMLFAEDKNFQKSMTKFPLILTSIDESETGETTLTSQYAFLPDDTSQYQIFPYRQDRLKWRMRYYFSDSDKEKILRSENLNIVGKYNSYRTMIVMLYTEDTCEGYKYIFEWDGCWFLREIIDLDSS